MFSIIRCSVASPPQTLGGQRRGTIARRVTEDAHAGVTVGDLGDRAACDRERHHGRHLDLT